MSKAINCPDMDSKEFKILLSKQSNSETAYQNAFAIWQDLGGRYPDEVIAEANPEVILEGTREPNTIQILNKQKIVENAIRVTTHKLTRLTNIGAKEEYIAEYTSLLIKLKEYNTEAAITEFVKTSERIINGALKTIDTIESEISKDKNVIYNMKGLDNIQTYIGALDLLKEIRKDSMDDPEFKDLIPVLESLISKQNDIIKKVRDLAKGILINDLSERTDIIEKYYERKAEKDFNLTENSRKLKGKERDQARRDFIQGYMEDNKGVIKARTRDYITGILTKVDDIPRMTSLLVNPKDINNPILSYAVELLDQADYNTIKRLNEQAEIFNDLYKKYTEFMGNKSNMEEFYAPLLERDIEGNLTGYLVNPTTRTDQYRELTKGKYKGTIVEELYNEIRKVQEENDTTVPGSSTLGYRLPSINKSLLERIYSENILQSTKESFLDAWRLTTSDTENGDIDERLNHLDTEKKIEVITNELGEEKQQVPIHYRSKFDAKSQSYDVLGLMMLDLQNVTNYKEKMAANIVLSLLKENLADGEIINRDWQDNLKIDRTDKMTSTKKGIHSNLYKNLEDIVKHRVYGIAVEGNPHTLKVINSLKSFVGHVNLSLNFVSAGANFAQGVSMEWIESIGGETGSFGRKNRANAYIKYTKDLPQIIKDINQNIPTSKTNLLAREFQINRLWNPRDRKFIENSIAKKIGVGGTLRAMDELGDDHLQAILMYAVMDNIKALDKDGNFLDKDFKPTKDRDKAIGLDDSYTVVKGKLILDSRVHSSERTPDLKDESKLKISKYVAKINRSLFGNYDPQNKAIAQRTILGHLVFQMRGWLIPGFERRWKGISKANIKSGDLSLSQLEYNNELGAFEEGNYTTTTRFVWQMVKELKAMKIYMVAENWKQLTDYEKGNIYKTISEAVLILGALGLAMMLKSSYDDDPEKDFATLVAAYYSRRLFSESFSYANPKEALRTFKSPAVILGTVEDLIDLAGQAFDPMEEYETGDRKGESKLKYRIKDITPIYKQYDKDINRSYLFLTK